MSNFSVELDKKRYCRYVIKSRLWDDRACKFGLPVNVMLDTGSFNTIVHESLVPHYGTTLPQTMKVSVGGYKGEAAICVLNKMNIGGLVLEKVIALAVPFDGELKNHILLGANVTNNWEFTVSRLKNRLNLVEEFSENTLNRKYPYRYCFNNKRQIMAFQEFELD